MPSSGEEVIPFLVMYLQPAPISKMLPGKRPNSQCPPTYLLPFCKRHFLTTNKYTRPDQVKIIPPSTTCVWPVTKSLSLLARKLTNFATSSGTLTRPSAVSSWAVFSTANSCSQLRTPSMVALLHMASRLRKSPHKWNNSETQKDRGRSESEVTY